MHLDISPTAFVLEPFVHNVSIEGIPVSISSGVQTSVISLRFGDIINFSDQCIHMELAHANIAAMATSPAEDKPLNTMANLNDADGNSIINKFGTDDETASEASDVEVGARSTARTQRVASPRSDTPLTTPQITIGPVAETPSSRVVPVASNLVASSPLDTKTTVGDTQVMGGLLMHEADTDDVEGADQTVFTSSARNRKIYAGRSRVSRNLDFEANPPVKDVLVMDPRNAHVIGEDDSLDEEAATGATIAKGDAMANEETITDNEAVVGDESLAHEDEDEDLDYDSDDIVVTAIETSKQTTAKPQLLPDKRDFPKATQSSNDDVPTSKTASRALGAAKKRGLPKAAHDSDDDEPLKKSRKLLPQLMPSTRQMNRMNADFTQKYKGQRPNLILSGGSKCKENHKLLSWLKKQGVHVLDSTPKTGTDYVCVVKVGKELPRTIKVLRALARGSTILTDDWLTDSHKAGQLLDTTQYTHPDPAAAVDLQRSRVFQGMTLYFTNGSYEKHDLDEWRELGTLAKDSGATIMKHGKQVVPKGTTSVMYFGGGDGDEGAMTLIAQGQTVYRKDLFMQSLLQGTLVVDDNEFKLEVKSVVGKTKGKKR